MGDLMGRYRSGWWTLDYHECPITRSLTIKIPARERVSIYSQLETALYLIA